MGHAVEALNDLQPRMERRAGEPSCDEVAGQLAVLMCALVESDRLAAGSQVGAEHSDSHGRRRAMAEVRDQLQAAAEALTRAGAAILRFYSETP